MRWHKVGDSIRYAWCRLTRNHADVERPFYCWACHHLLRDEQDK